MLLLIMGGMASGKSTYAAEWALSLGHEAIRLSCPPFPDEGITEPLPAPENKREGFAWMEMAADRDLASSLQLINRQSNIYRAETRVLIIDSLSGWLRGWASRAKETGWGPGAPEPDVGDSLRAVLSALLSFEGKRIVITEEVMLGLAADPWDRWYAAELSAAVRLLAEKSHSVYRLTAGMAAEVKGHRVKRGIPKHEPIYTDR
jgi:adenosylcobinamide kinase / adenosylcobinamide-phosphate guanylyltransferase